jgi:hypothetical protein
MMADVVSQPESVPPIAWMAARSVANAFTIAAAGLYLSEPGHEVHVELDEEPGVTEVRLLARTA